MSGGVADRLRDLCAAVLLVSDIAGLSEFLRSADEQLSLPAASGQLSLAIPPGVSAMSYRCQLLTSLQQTAAARTRSSLQHTQRRCMVEYVSE